MIAKLKVPLQRLFARHTVICVLGMHRSGTSFVTGSLQAGGAALHRFHSNNPFNRKGNRENPDIVALNDDILRASGGSWDRPPERVVWQREHHRRAREILREVAPYPVWAFKDPRTLLTLDGWLEHFRRPRFVGIIRHPARVARSLNSRDASLSPESGLRLWRHYNGILLRLRRQQAFPLLCFDHSPGELLAALQQACRELGLDPDEAKHFFDESLVNQQPGAVDEEELPIDEASMKLYQQLLACSIGNDQSLAADHEQRAGA